MTDQLYALRDAVNGGDAILNLTARQVVQHIYRDDGEDYRLEPRMCDEWDDDGEACHEVHDTLSDGTPIWNVWFKDRYAWKKSGRICFGHTEKEAEDNLLEDSFKSTAWRDAKWTILTMEEYQAEQQEEGK